MKLKIIHIAKDIIIQKNMTGTEWEQIFTNYTTDRELISEIHKELKTTPPTKTKPWISSKQINQLKDGAQN